MPESRRSDARRNYALILSVAEEEVAAHGADASLERIARLAKVGSATVRRHFPTRYALLEAVSRERVQALSARAQDLTGGSGGREALLAWLREVVTYCVEARGLAAALAFDAPEADPLRGNSCAGALEIAAGPLLQNAISQGEVTKNVTVADLIALIVGIVLVTERYPDHANQANRLFDLAVTGLNPEPGA